MTALDYMKIAALCGWIVVLIIALVNLVQALRELKAYRRK